MLAFFTSIILLFAGAAHAEPGEGGFLHFYNEYLNIPGFELWKFINLAIFIAILTYLLKKPLSEGFKAKRESIRAELIRAEQEKAAALERLTQAEAKITQLEADKQKVIRSAEEEANTDAARILEQTEVEIERIRRQTSGDLGRLAQQVRAELRKLSAEESIRLAEQKLRSRIDAEKDSRLVRASIQEIGGLN
jgi:F-type H+-transporting ATPase subunit b